MSDSVSQSVKAPPPPDGAPRRFTLGRGINFGLRLATRAAPVAWLWTRVNMMRAAGRSDRKLEIGPGPERLEGFETLSVRGGRHVDYVLDAARPLPFRDATFALIYASHVLEHLPWYRTDAILREWVRLLRPGGALEVWVPDGMKLAQSLVELETHGTDPTSNDPWYRLNPREDPYLWVSGRVYAYGDGRGRSNSPNWHRALFTPKSLQQAFERAGLQQVRRLEPAEVRGADHGWISLGMRGVKP